MYLKSAGKFSYRYARAMQVCAGGAMCRILRQRAPGWCAPRHLCGLCAIYNTRAMLVRVAKSQLRGPWVSARRLPFGRGHFQRYK